MALTLTSTDVERLTEAQRVLLSPFEHDDVVSWCTEVVDAVGALFRSDRTLFNLTHGGDVLSIWGPGLAPFGEVLREMVRGVEPGAIRYRDDHLDEALKVRRHSNLEIWSNRMVARMLDLPMEAMPFYREFMVPAGTVEGGGMTISLAEGEAMIGSNPGPPGRNPFGEDWLELFHLLLSSFKAGSRTLFALEDRRTTLVETLDTFSHAVGIWRLDGTEAHRSTALRALLEAEGESARIVAEIQALARRTSRLLHRRPKADPGATVRVGAREVSTASARFEIRSGLLASRMFGRDPVVLVTVQRLTPSIPAVAVLRDRFGLTRREADVARLLGLGLSERAIAERLCVSPHTIRSHGERIFRKVGVHDRGALMYRLLGAAPNRANGRCETG